MAGALAVVRLTAGRCGSQKTTMLTIGVGGRGSQKTILTNDELQWAMYAAGLVQIQT